MFIIYEIKSVIFLELNIRHHTELLIVEKNV